MKRIYNLEYLVSITIQGKEQHWTCTYKPYKKIFFGLKTQKEGFYDFFNDYIGTGKEVLMSDDNLILEENKLYYKPYVELKFIDGSKSIKRFDTFSQASKYGYDIASKNITSKLEIKD